MSYNPVADNTAAAIKAEAAVYSALYAEQGVKHVRYSWILWAGIACLLLVLLFTRLLDRSCRDTKVLQSLTRFCSRTTLFGHNLHTSRLQFICLTIYIVYNIVFSFADIPYGTSWRYTSRHSPGYVQMATPMQFIANRTGFLAFASVPLVFLLVTRYNIITLCSGVPYNALNLVHKCVGWTVLALTWVHTLLWTIEMGVNYHSADGYLATRWRQRYWLGGFFATFALCWMCLHSLAFVRRYTGYEFFRITHNVGSVLFIIGCWVHWPAAFQWIAAALAIYYADHLLRWSGILFHMARAGGLSQLSGNVFHDEDQVDVACIKITNSGLRSWRAGQHVYLYCLSLGEWEPHPFSVANTGRSKDELTLIIRQQGGMTEELLDTLQYKSEPIRTLIDGPYNALDRRLIEGRNVLLIAGGTGISFIMSVLHELRAMPLATGIQLKLVWHIRRNSNLQWVVQELHQLKEHLGSALTIDVIVSRESTGRPDFNKDETQTEKQDSLIYARRCSLNMVSTDGRSHGLKDTINRFLVGVGPEARVTVLGCGPGSMGPDIRMITESCGHKDLKCHIDNYCI